MEYDFRRIEKYWQDEWAKGTYHVEISSRPKYYVLDMFPYPSGAGLHVGHPLGYIASDIYARYKRLKGFNVLHPMGYDAFGLPAEQYAIQTGQHPDTTTKKNIETYRRQLDKIGFSFDWSREVKTSDPEYYRWTQWIFLKLFKSWYNKKSDKAESIETLVKEFAQNGNGKVEAVCDETRIFSAAEWNSFSEKEQQDILMNYRLAFLSETYVNWCPAMGTVLANEEVKDGVSERGGYPVERKRMPQWSLRITAYAQRLFDGLDKIDWSESLKETQRNWIGRSKGCTIKFEIRNSKFEILVFTTRPDTIFGVTFMVLAPEHELVEKITTPEQKTNVEEYVAYAKGRSERDRMTDVKKITGVFTGAFVEHPFTGKPVPIWIGDYVLAGYGTGAVMAVPGHDSRDHAFAKHFGLEIIPVVSPPAGWDIQKESYDAKEGKCINSDFLNGLDVKDSIRRAIDEVEKRGLGKGKINYRLRDAIFGRQRYWGEPIPIYYKDGIACAVDEKHLPIELPPIEKFLPTETGEPPLARAKNWYYHPDQGVISPPSRGGVGGGVIEKTTMPGWAGSSWYYLRYEDPKNEKEFASKDAINYWGNVDLYVGGAEHATGHLMYVRFWTKFLYDLGCLPFDEPAKKLVNQGMIQGRSYFRHHKIFVKEIDIKKDSSQLRLQDINSVYCSYDCTSIELNGEKYFIHPGCSRGETRTSITAVDHFNDRLYKDKYDEFLSLLPIKEDTEQGYYWDIDEHGRKYIKLSYQIEKMSKSKDNVINPDDMCSEYGADTLRMYEMFLGPVEMSKPWNTNGITGVHNFLKKFWKLFFTPLSIGEGPGERSGEAPTKAELKILHRTIKKVQDDIERFSFNTSVSTFMICVNELTELKCSKREILEPLVVLLSPFAPHIAEELWKQLGHNESVTRAKFPEFKEEYLTEDSFEYPVSVNGKTRFKINIALNLPKEEVEKEVLGSEEIKKWLNGNTPKKVIVVPGKIVNVVV